MPFVVPAEIEQYAEEHTTPVAAHLEALAEETVRPDPHPPSLTAIGQK